MGRARVIAIAISAMTGLLGAQAQAQSSAPTTIERLRQCGRIADVPARVACYDAIPTDEPQAAALPATAALPPEPAQPAGFGSRQPAHPGPSAEQPEAIEATVAAAVEREPGIHLLTLEDGAEWLFVEGVRASYDPPRRGSKIEIRSAALGSYLLRFQDQPAVRVRRVR